jgi:thymidylate synthase
MKDGFPLLTTKKMPFKTIVTELLWFLRGETNIKYLVENGCNIWNGDCYKNYQRNQPKSFPAEVDSNLSKKEFINKIKTDDEFAKKWGDLGPIYGKQWRRWSAYPNMQGEYGRNPFDQIQNLINDLNSNPDDRGLIVSAWNVGELKEMVLRPCHNFFQVYTRELSLDERADWLRNKIISENESDFENVTSEWMDEKYIPSRAISLMWNQRSVDTFLGLPFNIASYGLLLEIIAKDVNMVPDQLIGNFGDTHLYLNHLEQAKEQIGRYFTPDERLELLKQAMGEEKYQNSVDEQVPFGGGLSEYFEIYNITPELRTRKPFPLPTLELTGTWKFLSSSPCFGDTIKHEDIKLNNYKSHSEIKAPLSN